MQINFLLENKLKGYIKIKLADTLTAKTFIQAVSQTNLISKQHNHSVARSKIEIVNDYIRLKQIKDLINASSYDRKIDTDIESDFSTEKLFDLHEHFEHVGHRYRTKDPSLDLNAYEEIIHLGCEMNGIIHKLEGTLYGSWFQAAFTKPNFVRIPLNEEIIAEGQAVYKKDSLYVGYGETGKNMAISYSMNDVGVLERKMVQPQRSILSEFFLPFYDDKFDIKHYQEWCIKHGAEEKGYDYMNPIWYAKWEIGEITEKSFRDLSLFPNYDTITLDL